jgi:hypothetical protein
MSKHHDKPVDMSVPPEERRRKPKQYTVGQGAAAQMDHASGPKAKKKARQGEKRMHQDRYA